MNSLALTLTAINGNHRHILNRPHFLRAEREETIIVAHQHKHQNSKNNNNVYSVANLLAISLIELRFSARKFEMF